MMFSFAWLAGSALAGAGLGSAVTGWYFHRGIKGMITDVHNDVSFIKGKFSEVKTEVKPVSAPVAP